MKILSSSHVPPFNVTNITETRMVSGRNAASFLRLSLPVVHERRRGRVGLCQDVDVGKNHEPAYRQEAQRNPCQHRAPEDQTGYRAPAG